MEKASDWFWDWQSLPHGTDSESEEEVEDVPADQSDSTETPTQDVPADIQEFGQQGDKKDSKRTSAKSDLTSRLADFFPDLLEGPEKEEVDGAQKEEDIAQAPETWVPDFFAQEEGSAEVVEMAGSETSPEAVAAPGFDLTSPTSLPVSFGPGGSATFLGVEQGHEKDVQQANAVDEASQPEPAQQNNAQEREERVPPASASPTTKESPMIEEIPASSMMEETGQSQQDSIEPDDVIGRLGRLQLSLPVPTVARLRAARPLHIARNELWATQFVLHHTQQDFNAWMSQNDKEFHPHLGDVEEAYGRLEDDGTPVIFQKNGIARLMEVAVHKTIRCSKTGAPGYYDETFVTAARIRTGKGRGGFAGAKKMNTRKLIKENLFYTFKSCWMYLACQGPPGEFHPEDPGARVFIRRSARDFRQFAFLEFPIGKQICDLLEHENTVFLKNFTYKAPKREGDENALVVYDRASLRSWQAYEHEGKPPPDDAAQMLVQAARTGHVNNLKKLVLQRNLDANLILTEFGAFGTGRLQSFTRSENAYAEERTALVAAIESGWQSVVETIIEFAQAGKADLNVLCTEWNPKGAGGPGLREKYTALDMARIYHRYEIHAMLERAGAKPWQNCLQPRARMRENPFKKRARNDKGDYNDEDEFNSNENKEDEFSFADFHGSMEIDPEMEKICKGLAEEMAAFTRIDSEDAAVKKFWKTLQLRWHPDKCPDDKKDLGTRVFQWIQHQKDSLSWESRAWSA